MDKSYNWMIFIVIVVSLFVGFICSIKGWYGLAKLCCLIPIILSNSFLIFFWPEFLRDEEGHPRKIITFYLVHYIFIIFVFALIYIIIDISGEKFNSLSTVTSENVLVDFFYYSLITATTVGYGECYPVSSYAKLFTSVEPLVTAVFFVTLFSTFSSFKTPILKKIYPDTKDL